MNTRRISLSTIYFLSIPDKHETDCKIPKQKNRKFFHIEMTTDQRVAGSKIIIQFVWLKKLIFFCLSYLYCFCRETRVLKKENWSCPANRLSLDRLSQHRNLSFHPTVATVKCSVCGCTRIR